MLSQLLSAGLFHCVLAFRTIVTSPSCPLDLAYFDRPQADVTRVTAIKTNSFLMLALWRQVFAKLICLFLVYRSCGNSDSTRRKEVDASAVTAKLHLRAKPIDWLLGKGTCRDSQAFHPQLPAHVL